MRSTIRIISFLMGSILLLSISGVFATWQYCGNPTSARDNVSLIFSEFVYKPEEVLPDTDEDSDEGVNHSSILEQILNSSKFGVNKTNVIERNMEAYQYVISCYENGISGGNMNNIPNAENLGFVVQGIPDGDDIASYVLYTFDKFSAYTQGDKLLVYKTFIEMGDDGKWYGKSTKIGYVVLSSLSVRSIKGNYYILPSEWISGPIPKANATA